MIVADFHKQFHLYQNLNPSKYELATPRSAFYSIKGNDIVIFWGVTIVVIIGLMVALKSLFGKK